MVRESFTLEPNRSPVPHHSQDMVGQAPTSLEGTTIIIMEAILSMGTMETIMVALGMEMEEMVMEETEINTVPTILHQ